MIPETTDQARAVVQRAARRFIRRLIVDEMIDRTARVETTLHAGAEAAVFAADRAFARLWPRDLGMVPAHEVIWARDEGAFEGVCLAAFDIDGRALLREFQPVLTSSGDV